jgi:hypothetical protein
MRASVTVGLIVAALHPLAGTAQENDRGIRPQAGLEIAYWLLDGGTGSTSSQSRWGPTARVGLRPSPTSPVSAGLALAYAPEGSFEPGVAGGTLEIALRFARLDEVRRRRLNGFFVASLGLLHFDADQQDRARTSCLASPTCQFEGVWYSSGWRPIVGGGIGADVPLGASLVLQPQAQVLKPFGSANAGPEHNSAMLRLGLGVGWR